MRFWAGGEAHGRKPQEMTGRFQGSTIENASQLSQDVQLSRVTQSSHGTFTFFRTPLAILVQGEIIHAPPLPCLLARRHLSGGGYILKPPGAGSLFPPPFYTPPSPKRVFQGWGGWRCIKFGLAFKHKYNLVSRREFSK